MMDPSTIVLIILLILIVSVGVGAGVWYLIKKQENNNNNNNNGGGGGGKTVGEVSNVVPVFHPDGATGWSLSWDAPSTPATLPSDLVYNWYVSDVVANKQIASGTNVTTTTAAIGPLTMVASTKYIFAVQASSASLNSKSDFVGVNYLAPNVSTQNVTINGGLSGWTASIANVDASEVDIINAYVANAQSLNTTYTASPTRDGVSMNSWHILWPDAMKKYLITPGYWVMTIVFNTPIGNVTGTKMYLYN